MLRDYYHLQLQLVSRTYQTLRGHSHPRVTRCPNVFQALTKAWRKIWGDGIACVSTQNVNLLVGAQRALLEHRRPASVGEHAIFCRITLEGNITNAQALT